MTGTYISPQVSSFFTFLQLNNLVSLCRKMVYVQSDTKRLFFVLNYILNM